MPTLSPTQIAYYAYKAGFRGAALNQAVAIALAESGGRVEAYNPEAAAGTKAGSGSRGLWQIYGSAHPEFNNSQAFDPMVNARAAFKVFKEAGNRFTPWSTYNAGIARPTLDFSKINFDSRRTQTANPLPPAGQVIRGSTTPIMTGALSGAATQAGGVIGSSPIGATGSAAATPTLRSFLGLEESKTGPKSPEDVAFLVIGSGLVLIGILGLMIAGVTGSLNAQGDFIRANGAKIAASAL